MDQLTNLDMDPAVAGATYVVRTILSLVPAAEPTYWLIATDPDGDSMTYGPLVRLSPEDAIEAMGDLAMVPGEVREDVDLDGQYVLAHGPDGIYRGPEAPEGVPSA